jgi:hypothetical protein
LEEASSRVAGPDGRSLIAYLQHAGLVRLHLWEQVDFVHLTFQEFYLAQALRQHGLLQALQRHWGEARYEETLGLLISLLWQDGQYTDIDQGVRWLVAWGEAAHRHTPHRLWQHRRSPLRVALHLLYRAGVSLEHLPTTAGFLWEKICSSQARKEATAVDAKTPSCILRVGPGSDPSGSQVADTPVRRPQPQYAASGARPVGPGCRDSKLARS